MTALQRYGALAAPGLLAAGMVLTIYADTGALLYELPRPLFALAGLATLVELAVLGVTRRITWASVAGVAVVGAFFAPRIVLALLLVALVYREQARLRRRPQNPMATTLLAFAAIFFIVGLARVVTGPAFDLRDLIRQSAPPPPAAAPGSPDIYLVFLDGYPRSDTLAGWGYDNTWFENELEDRGFDVASESTSSYPFTGLVTASMLNMAHIDDIPQLQDPPDDHVLQTRLLAAALNESEVLAELERRGYWTVHTGLTEVRGALRNVDQDIDTGEVRLWERQILQRTRWWNWLCEEVVVPQHRSLIRSTFGAIEDVADTSRDAPTFMLAHVMSPHTPIVFDAEGDPSEFRGANCGVQFGIDASLIGVTDEVYGAAMSKQVHFINTSTLSAVDAIIESSPNAVVVVFSDHGARYSTEVNDEWFASFFAARAPGHPNLFGDDARPIDIFPTLFNAYFDMDVPKPDDRMATSTNGIYLPLDMEPYPNGE